MRQLPPLFITVEGKEVEGWQKQGCWERNSRWWADAAAAAEAKPIPDPVDPDWIESAFLDVQRTGRLLWLGRHPIAFDLQTDLVWRRGEFLPEHSNAMQFTARTADGTECSRCYFSVGGGFVVDQEELAAGQTSAGSIPDPPMPFATAAELLPLCHRHGLSIADVVLRNEKAVRDA